MFQQCLCPKSSLGYYHHRLHDGKFMELFLDVVKNGAEAMDVYVQDPPRSYGDLEGA